MRLTDRALALITDAYVKVEVEGNATSLGDIELGVCYDAEVEDATPIDEAPRYAVVA